MSTAPETQPQAEKSRIAEKARIDARRYIWRWLIAGAAVIVIALVISMLLRQQAQLSLVADLMLTVMVLCPMLICMLPLYIGLWLLVAVVGRADRSMTRQLTRLENVTGSLAERTAKAGESLAERSIAFSARFAMLNSIFGAFEPQHKRDVEDERQPQGESEKNNE